MHYQNNINVHSIKVKKHGNQGGGKHNNAIEKNQDLTDIHVLSPDKSKLTLKSSTGGKTLLLDHSKSLINYYPHSSANRLTSLESNNEPSNSKLSLQNQMRNTSNVKSNKNGEGSQVNNNDSSVASVLSNHQNFDNHIYTPAFVFSPLPNIKQIM